MKCVYCHKPIKIDHGQLAPDEKGITFNGQAYHGGCMDKSNADKIIRSIGNDAEKQYNKLKED